MAGEETGTERRPLSAVSPTLARPEPGEPTNAPVTGALSEQPEGMTPFPVTLANEPFDLKGPEGTISPFRRGLPGVWDRARAAENVTEKFIRGGQDRGSFWRGILGGALTGMAAGAQTGHFGQGVAAGARAAAAQEQQMFQRKIEVDREKSEQQYRQALTAHTLQQTANAAWELARNQTKATEEDAVFSMTMAEKLRDIPGVINLGQQQGPLDIKKVLQQHPELAKSIAQGSIVTVPFITPVVDKDGKPTGQSVFGGSQSYFIPPDESKKLIDKDWSIPVYMPNQDPSKPGHYDYQLLKAGEWTVRDATTALMGASHAAGQQHSAEERAATAEERLELARERLDFEKSKQITPEQLEADAQQLFRDPMSFDLVKIASMRAGDREKLYSRAAEIFRQHGKTFYPQQVTDAWKAVDSYMGDGKNALNLLSGNTAVRHLGELVPAAKALGNGDTQVLNRIAQEVNANIGKDNITTYRAIVTALSSEVSTAYKNNTAPTDPEIANIAKILDEAQAPAQAFSSASTVALTMAQKLQGHYRNFSNSAMGHKPEDFGIKFIEDDVQDTLRSLGITPITPYGSPRRIQAGAGGGGDNPYRGLTLPNWVPHGSTITVDPNTGQVNGYWDAKGGFHGAPR